MLAPSDDQPRLSDAELVTLAVISALLGFGSERGFVRFAREHLRPWFPYVPNSDGYNKRLRRVAAMIAWVIDALARDCPDWHDDVWLADSTPVPNSCARCGRRGHARHEPWHPMRRSHRRRAARRRPRLLPRRSLRRLAAAMSSGAAT